MCPPVSRWLWYDGGNATRFQPSPIGWLPEWSGFDGTLVKALGRAFRWCELLETCVHGMVDEIARAEGINPSYVSRTLCLTLLAPDIVVSIFDGRPPPVNQRRQPYRHTIQYA